MTDVLLGARPRTMTLALVEGADFICTLASSDGDWPSSAAIKLLVGDLTWTATLNGPDATWNIDKAVVQSVITANTKRFRLVCTDGTFDAVWGQGSVTVVRNV